MRTLSFLILTLFVSVPVSGGVKFLTATHGVDDCVKIFAKNLAKGEVKEGYVYSIGKAGTHMDSEILPLPVLGKSYGCINVTGNPFADVFNTVYCGESYAYYSLTER